MLKPSAPIPISPVPLRLEKQLNNEYYQELIDNSPFGDTPRNRFESLAARFVDGVMDPVGWFSMLGAGWIFRGARGAALLGLERLGTTPNGAAWMGANLGAFALEATSFPILGNLAQDFLGREADWEPGHMTHAIGASFLMLGGLKSAHVLGMNLLGWAHPNPVSLTLGQRGFLQASQYLGILSGRSLEHYFGLGPSTSFSDLAVESLVTHIQFNGIGRILPKMTPQPLRDLEGPLRFHTQRLRPVWAHAGLTLGRRRTPPRKFSTIFQSQGSSGETVETWTQEEIASFKKDLSRTFLLDWEGREETLINNLRAFSQMGWSPEETKTFFLKSISLDPEQMWAWMEWIPRIKRGLVSLEKQTQRQIILDLTQFIKTEEELNPEFLSSRIRSFYYRLEKQGLDPRLAGLLLFFEMYSNSPERDLRLEAFEEFGRVHSPDPMSLVRNSLIPLLSSTNWGEAQATARILACVAKRLTDQRLISEIYSALDLYEIQFGDGGGSFSTVTSFLGDYFYEPKEMSDQEYLLTRPDRMADSLSHHIYKMDLEKWERLQELFGAGGFSVVQGRTYLFPMENSDSFLALKTLHPEDRPKLARGLLIGDQGIQSQPIRAMLREAHWLKEMKHHPELRSAYPRVLTDSRRRPFLLEFKEGELRNRYGPYAIAMVAPRSYYRYLDETELSEEELYEGLERSIHDVFTLGRKGIFHTTPLAFFHTQGPGSIRRPSGDQGRFVLSPDLVFGGAGGMGRLDAWRKALRHGNFGVSGLRDLEELWTLGGFVRNLSDIKPELMHAFRQEGIVEPVLRGVLLGNSLLGASLYWGRHMVDEYQPGESGPPLWKNESRLEDHGKKLLNLFATAHSRYHNYPLSQSKDLLSQRVQWLRLARQLAFFLSPDYAPYLRPGRPTTEFPKELIYGNRVLVRGWSYPHVFGRYRRGTFDPELGFVDNRGGKEEMALGPVNGPFPPRELEKAIWAVTLDPNRKSQD